MLEVPKPSYPPYFDQLSERYQPLYKTIAVLFKFAWTAKGIDLWKINKLRISFPGYSKAHNPGKNYKHDVDGALSLSSAKETERESEERGKDKLGFCKAEKHKLDTTIMSIKPINQ